MDTSVELGDIFNPQYTYASQMKADDVRNATIQQQLAQAKVNQASANKMNLLAPLEADKMRYENNPDVRSTELRGKNAVASLNENQAAAIKRAVDDKSIDEVVNGTMRTYKALYDQGMALGSAGKGGAEAAQLLRQRMQSYAEQTKDPDQKQRIMKQYQDLDTYIKASGLERMSPQQLVQFAQKGAEQVNSIDPEMLKVKAKGSIEMQIQAMRNQGAMNVASVRGAGTAQGSKDMSNYLKANPATKYTTSSAAVQSGVDPFTGKELTADEYKLWQSRFQADAAAVNAGLAAKQQPGVTGQVGAGGAMSLQNKEPVQVPTNVGQQRPDPLGIR